MGANERRRRSPKAPAAPTDLYTGAGSAETTADTQAASAQREDGSKPVLPTVLSAAALVVALGAAALAFRRGRA